MKTITTQQAKMAFCKSQCRAIGVAGIKDCMTNCGGCTDYNNFVTQLNKIKGQ